MLCPVCEDVVLQAVERLGIEIDHCPRCRGVWLDRGELDKLLERTAAGEGGQPEAGGRPGIDRPARGPEVGSPHGQRPPRTAGEPIPPGQRPEYRADEPLLPGVYPQNPDAPGYGYAEPQGRTTTALLKEIFDF